MHVIYVYVVYVAVSALAVRCVDLVLCVVACLLACMNANEMIVRGRQHMHVRQPPFVVTM